MTHKELSLRLVAAKEEVARFETELASHPETVKGFFGGMDHPLFQRVTKVERASGWTDSRKNPCSWEGFRFTFDLVEYEARYGSNWCSSVKDVGPVSGQWNEYVPLGSWEGENGNPDDLSQDFRGVGLALMILNGVIEE